MGRRKRVYTREYQGNAVLEAAASEGEDAVLDPAPALKNIARKFKGVMAVALPAEQALLRIVELPSTDAEEIAGMVELQVDKFAPFPIEQMAVAHEVLKQDEQQTRVLITAIRIEVVEETGALFHKAGLLCHWLDIDLLSWWTLLWDNGRIPEHGTQTVLILDEDTAFLLVAMDGTPIILRSMGRAVDAAWDELAEDLAYTLTASQTEWNISEEGPVNVWYTGSEPEGLAAALKNTCGLPVSLHELDELPPLSEGIAMRAASEKPLINLAPSAWHEQEKARKVRHTLLAASALVLGIWLAAVSVFWFGLQLQKKRLARLLAASETADAATREVRIKRDKVLSLRQYGDRGHSALECLREVTALLPEGVELISFGYHKGKSVSLKGHAKETGSIYDFISALEKSSFFGEIKFEGLSQGNKKGSFNVVFPRITCELPGDEK